MNENLIDLPSDEWACGVSLVTLVGRQEKCFIIYWVEEFFALFFHTLNELKLIFN